jgi:hypothetical protein
MPLLKDSVSRFLRVALLILMLVAVWLIGSRETKDAEKVSAKMEEDGVSEERIRSAASSGSLPPAPSSSTPRITIDPMHQEMADRLHSDETTPQQDLETIAHFISIHGKVHGGNPIGGNEDITLAMTGYGGKQGLVFPPGHRTIKNGQLTDRWGTPYWFHPNSGNQMEIRSAGPDRELFTQDDSVLNPSPAGLGVTPPPPAPHTLQ